ncbi:MAG: hypothetical protein J6R89_06040, partial [Clostridia bacterium]|nr:hypothetical protein [Clostridia bacterium]
MKLSELLPDEFFLSPRAPSLEVHGVASHTDEVKEGDLFVCKKGLRFDPSFLLPTVEKKGAVAIISEEDAPPTPLHIPFYKVRDAREAEATLLRRFYRWSEGTPKLIGVTGTNGKTSTAWMIRHVLKESGVSCGYIGTLGVFSNEGRLPQFSEEGATTPPPALLFPALAHLRDRGAEAIVMEVSSHALDQKRVFGLSFDVGVFTNLTEDYLAYHHPMDNYFTANCLLFEHTKQAVIILDDPYGK